jgi:uncharacterized membrane protein YbhN (UPF0104 family)
LRLAVVGIAAATLIHFIRAEDVHRARVLVTQVGWPLALVLLPTLLALSLDAAGWELLLSVLGHTVSWRRMLELRLSVEALVLALPGGSLAGEVAKVALLGRRTGVPASRGGASLALTKASLITSDGLYLAVAAVIAWASARARGGALWPAGLAAGGALFTAVIGIGMFALLREASLATRFAAWLGGLGSVRLRSWIEARGHAVADIDDSARTFFAAPLAVRIRCVIPFALEWFVEGAETILILKLLGAPLGIGDLLLLDAVGSLLRVLVFFVPAGLGIQDAAAILLLRGFGVPDPVPLGTAYIVIKRTKEVFWIAAGSLFLAVRRDLWRSTNA